MPKFCILYNNIFRGGIVILETDLPDKKIGDIFKPNKPISIFVNSNNDQDSQPTYKYQSNVERLTAVNLEILVPVRGGVQVFLDKNDAFLIRVRFQKEIYEFNSSYLYKSTSHTPVWIVQIPYGGKKIQQRTTHRLNFSVPIKVWKLNEFDEAIGAPNILVIKDISSSGLKIISKLPYSLSSKLQLVFVLPDYGEIRALGQVLRVQTFQHKNIPLFFNAVKFFYISEENSNKIDEFIFRHQQ